jgi:hypothetical protein
VSWQVWLGRGVGEGQVGERGGEYRRRQPEGTVLYEVVRDNLATLLAEASEVGRGLPLVAIERTDSPQVNSGVSVEARYRSDLPHRSKSASASRWTCNAVRCP